MSKDVQLDRMLEAWASSDAASAGDDAAFDRMVLHGQAIASAARTEPRPRRGWLGLAGGGAIAASLVVAIVGMTMLRQPPAQPAGPATHAVVEAAAGLDAGDEAALESFALLHVPTDEEEEALI